MALGTTNLSDAGVLRARLQEVRQELTAATQAYRSAIAERDSERAIPLLRSRSRLMRQLLDTQCELLLMMRSEALPAEPQSVSAGHGEPVSA